MPLNSHFGFDFYFDFLAPVYDEVFGQKGVEGIMRHLELEPGRLVLDLGGGTGRVSGALGDDRGHRTVICDPSRGMAGRAAGKGLPVCRGLAERLPFGDESFDRVMMVDTFHHLARHHDAAREILRVLRPGGRFVMDEPDITTWPVKVIALAEKLLLMRSRFFNPAEIARMFEDAGAEVRCVREAYTLFVIVDKADKAA